MKKYFLTVVALTIGVITFAQNEYQSQLYSLNDRLNSLEKKYFPKKAPDDKFLLDKFDLIKDLLTCRVSPHNAFQAMCRMA